MSLPGGSTVDPAARRTYSQLIRRFAAGQCTNLEYDDAAENLAFQSEDPALAAVFWQIWYLYDDLRKHRLRGKHALTPEARRVIARCILFLRTEQPYSWSTVSGGLAGCLMNLMTLGLYGLARRLAFGPEDVPAADDVPGPDDAVWPFRDADGFRRACFDPHARLLAAFRVPAAS